MAYQTVFKRYELKYTLTLVQKARLLAAMAPYMALDQYGRTTICNLYYDTDDYRLIRHSIEKPVYKEKLRLRSYGPASAHCPVFVELKKKYDHVVYKRRLPMVHADAVQWLSGTAPCPTDCQIGREIDYFLHYYPGLHPTVWLSYEREAYYAKDGGDFRVTFDDRLLARTGNLSLDSDPGGTSLLPEDTVLMELKCNGGIPLWMAHILTDEQLRKTSFSKYGMAYQTLLYPETPYFHTESKENALYGNDFQRSI